MSTLSPRALALQAPPSPTPPAPGSSSTMAILMSACVTVVVAMVAAINLALPELSASALRPTSTQLLWIVDAYILVFGCLLIPAGAIADRFGRKGALLGGLGVFAAGCFTAAAATTFPVLLAGRVVSGAGAALVMPATLSLLLQVTPPERRGRAIAGWSAATGAAGALGNLGGGLVLQWFSWRGLFLVFGPLALVLAALVGRIAPRGERRPASLDPLGTALLTTAVFGLLFAIIEASERGWTSTTVLASFAATAVSGGAFVAHGLHSRNPILDPRLFRISRLRAGTIGVGGVFFGLFALFFVNAQYLQYVKGHSPLATGVAILPLPLVMIVVSRRSASLVERFGARALVTSGMTLLTLGLMAMSFMTGATPYLPYGFTLVAIATGMGLSVPALSTGIVASLPPAQSGTASGLNSAAREIGAALGVAVIGTVISGRFTHELPATLSGHHSTSQVLRAARELGPDVHSQATDAFTHAMASGFRVVAAVVGAVAVTINIGLRVRSVAGSRSSG